MSPKTDLVEEVEPVPAKASSNLGASSKSAQTCQICGHFVKADDDACAFCGYQPA